MNASDVRDRILSDLRRERRELEALEARIVPIRERIESLESALSVFDRYAKMEQGGDALEDDGAESVKDAALDVIHAATRPMSIPDIAEGILASDFSYEHGQDTLERSLRGIVSRLHRKGLVERVSRGMYGPLGMSEQGDLMEGAGQEETPEAVGAASGAEGSPASTKEG